MTDDAADQVRGRALSSPLRMRILRFCLHESHSNREIATEFDLNPGTSLHHVRTLLDTGLIVAEVGRPGRRGTTEIPYRATGLSWSSSMPDQGPILGRTNPVSVWRLGFKFNAATENELSHRISELLVEFKDRVPDADGRPLSIMVAVHPEQRKPG